MKNIFLLQVSILVLLLVGCGSNTDIPQYEPEPFSPTELPIVNDDENYDFSILPEEPAENEEQECYLYPPIPIVLTDPRVRWLVESIWAFDAVFPFTGGMAAVEYYDRESTDWVYYEHILGYVNRQGEIVIPVVHRHWPGFYSHRGAPPFSHGLVAVQSNDYGGVGIFDTYGNLVVPFSFSDAWTFSEGLMAVRAPFVQDEEGNWTDSGWGFIDTTGELVIDYEFRYASAFNEGRSAVLSDDGLWGFIDTRGELVIPFQFQHLSGQGDGFFLPRFSEGLAAINVGEGWDWDWWPGSDVLWGYIDMYGEMVVPAIYTHASDFFGGFASVTHEEYGWGFIDRSGNFTKDIPPVVDNVYRAEFLPTHYNRFWGFADREDNIIVPIEFHEVHYFSEGLAWVRQGRWWGIIEIAE